MLERSADLQTWALPSSPDSPEPMVATSLEPHRTEYLTYEGPVSHGRGSVTRWDEGTYTLERDDTGSLVVVVDGEKLNGRVELVRPQGDSTEWRYVYSAS
jgi:hypothetical protein